MTSQLCRSLAPSTQLAQPSAPQPRSSSGALSTRPPCTSTRCTPTTTRARRNHSENSHYGHHLHSSQAHHTVADVTEGQQLQDSDASAAATAQVKGAHFSGLHTYYDETSPLNYHTENCGYGQSHHHVTSPQVTTMTDGQQLPQTLQAVAPMVGASTSASGRWVAFVLDGQDLAQINQPDDKVPAGAAVVNPSPGHLTLGFNSLLAGAVEAYVEGPRGEAIGSRDYNDRLRAKTLENASSITPLGAVVLDRHVLPAPEEAEERTPRDSDSSPDEGLCVTL